MSKRNTSWMRVVAHAFGRREARQTGQWRRESRSSDSVAAVGGRGSRAARVDSGGGVVGGVGGRRSPTWARPISGPSSGSAPPGLSGSAVVCETTYGTPIEAPSKVANMRGRPAMRANLHIGSIFIFGRPTRDHFANRPRAATSATGRPSRSTQDDLLRRTCRLRMVDRRRGGGDCSPTLPVVTSRCTSRPTRLRKQLFGRPRPSAAGASRAAAAGGGEIRPRRRDVFHAARPRTGDRPVGRGVQGAAIRRAEHGPIADLCCGIGGDLVALAGSRSGDRRRPRSDRSVLRGCECPRRRTQRASHPSRNVRSRIIRRWRLRGLAHRSRSPSRRQSHHVARMEQPEPRDASNDCSPRRPNAAIKLAPAAEVPANLGRSLRTGMDQPRPPVPATRRLAWRARRMPGPTSRDGASPTDGRGRERVVGEPERAACRSRANSTASCSSPIPPCWPPISTGALAAEHGLSAISAGIAYLTGPAPIDDPALACFEVEEVLPLDLRQIAGHLRERRHRPTRNQETRRRPRPRRPSASSSSSRRRSGDAVPHQAQRQACRHPRPPNRASHDRIPVP